jgi:hypothetical protein
MARDILGLGGPDSNVKNLEPAGPAVSSHDSDEAARRRRRMNEGADELTPGPTGVNGGNGGATGIDMGAGGEGTDIE